MPDTITPTETSLHPYLCAQDALRAIEFYKTVFGAVEEFPPLVGPDGKVGHSELRVGQSKFAVADEYPEEGVLSPLTLGGTPVQLTLHVPDVDVVFARAVAAGATVVRPVSEQPYGERAGKIRDPFGHNWFISTVIEDLEPTEIAERFSGQGYELQTSDESSVGGDGGADPSGPTGPTRPLGPTDTGQLFYFTFGVADGNRARDFFAGLFGWEIRDGHMPGAFHIANPTPPGGIAPGAAAPTIDLYFRVDDIQAAVSRVRQLGGQADEPVLYASGWSATCHDDQGLAFYLSEPAPGY